MSVLLAKFVGSLGSSKLISSKLYPICCKPTWYFPVYWGRNYRTFIWRNWLWWLYSNACTTLIVNQLFYYESFYPTFLSYNCIILFLTKFKTMCKYGQTIKQFDKFSSILMYSCYMTLEILSSWMSYFIMSHILSNIFVI
jgi:hypothetical protein